MSFFPTIYVVDNDRTVIESVAELLSTDGFAIRAYGYARAFLSDIGENDRGCVIADLMIPDMGGLELLGELRERGVALPVIVITAYGDVQLAVEAMRQGAVDFLEKPFSGDALLNAIRTALPFVGREEARIVRERLAKLTKREKDVLTGLLKGKPNKIIAHEFGISARTVEVHRANLMSKMEAASLAELIRMSIQ
jgi:two-component system, LuxR family, response regulator FixJ